MGKHLAPRWRSKDNVSKARLYESAPPDEEKYFVTYSLSCQSNRGLLNQLARQSYCNMARSVKIRHAARNALRNVLRRQP